MKKVISIIMLLATIQAMGSNCVEMDKWYAGEGYEKVLECDRLCAYEKDGEVTVAQSPMSSDEYSMSVDGNIVKLKYLRVTVIDNVSYKIEIDLETGEGLGVARDMGFSPYDGIQVGSEEFEFSGCKMMK